MVPDTGRWLNVTVNVVSRVPVFSAHHAVPGVFAGLDPESRGGSVEVCGVFKQWGPTDRGVSAIHPYRRGHRRCGGKIDGQRLAVLFVAVRRDRVSDYA